jgi:hypothetical protein
MYFGESILAKSVFGHFFCPFLKIPKNFPGKKLDILNNKSLKVLKATATFQPQRSWIYS